MYLDQETQKLTLLRVRYQVSSASAINYSEEASRLADIISAYNIN